MTLMMIVFCSCRISSSFTTECILATAFGRHVNVLRGETSKLSKLIDIIIGGLTGGQVEGMIVLESKDIVSCCQEYIRRSMQHT